MARARGRGRLESYAFFRTVIRRRAEPTLFATRFAIVRQRGGAKELVMRPSPAMGIPGHQEPRWVGSRRNGWKS